MAPNTILKESVKNGIPTIHVEKLSLFHGSSMEGINILLPAIDSTVARGTYFTSERHNAELYALLRSNPDSLTLQYTSDPGEKLRKNIVTITGPKVPVVYEVGIENMDFVDIRTPEKFKQVMKGFRDYLSNYRIHMWESAKKEFSVAEGVELEQIERAIGTIDVLEGTESEFRAQSGWKNPEKIGPKHVLQNTEDKFTKYLQSLGYDGVVAIEGGEGQIGRHDSWIIFDSEKINIVETVKILKTETHSELLGQS